MGFITNWKAKRQQKLVASEFNFDFSNWEKDVAIFKKITTAFEAAANGKDSVSNLTVQKKGEIVLWRGQGQFHEAGRTAGTFQASSQGFSIPIVAGIRYRVGATRGTYVSGDPVQKYAEVGDVVLTTQRVLFNGMFNTKEWAFSKWNGAATSPEEDDFIFHVSNRQKTSGILFSVNDGREFNRFLAAALIAAEQGIPIAMKEIAEDVKALAEDKPMHTILALEAPQAT
jgi:hypothetical protein